MLRMRQGACGSPCISIAKDKGLLIRGQIRSNGVLWLARRCASVALPAAPLPYGNASTWHDHHGGVPWCFWLGMLHMQECCCHTGRETSYRVSQPKPVPLHASVHAAYVIILGGAVLHPLLPTMWPNCSRGCASALVESLAVLRWSAVSHLPVNCCVPFGCSTCSSSIAQLLGRRLVLLVCSALYVHGDLSPLLYNLGFWLT
jgi:hypothetical protein